MDSLAFVFPGQGSQQLGMLADIAAQFPQVHATYQEASDALGYDLWHVVQQDEARLNQTAVTQPALLAASVALWRIWQAQGGKSPAYMAGHSLGEYSALVCAGALSFADGVRLVAKRGELMQQAVPEGVGAMAAIIGLDDVAVQAACAEIHTQGVVSAANFNSPGQVVIAGQSQAVEAAMQACKTKGAKLAKRLAVSVPSHCALMKPAAEALAADIRAIHWSLPNIPVVQNVDAQVHTNIASIQQALLDQLHQPVRWVQCVQHLQQLGCQILIECGPGKVLTGLNKRIIDVKLYSTQDIAALQEALTQ